MSESAEFTIGAEVACTDGVCGRLRRVVVDPVARTITHLVVEPGHWKGGGRLVPIDLVGTAAKEIRLRCARAEFETLEDAEETQFWPGASGPWAYRQDQMLSSPYYGLGGMGGSRMVGLIETGPLPVVYEKVPVGEVQVHRGDPVHATDGEIGRVHGLIIDPSDHQVTHVLLDEGHLWGKKEVAIPINAVTGLEDGVQLKLTRSEVKDLPPVDINRTGG
jgi:sporulation protein YlmC with PRC-barrel domain